MGFRDFIAKAQIGYMKGKAEGRQLSIPEDLLRPKHLLVCLPGGLRELTMVKQLLPTIAHLFKSADITLLTLPGIKVYDIYPRKGFQILTPSLDQVTWTGLPKKSYLQTLCEYKFDTILDLNLEASTFTSTVLLKFPGAIRIGRGNHLGTPFYNLEIKTKYLRDERNIYRSLLATLAAIMKKPVDGLSPVTAY
ncbi:MAG: hypothetical protein AB1772_03360 [Candidatus Zixiibacteriota bacterium]